MININDRQNEYWTASPLRAKSGSNIVTVTYAFSLSDVYSLLRPKSLCLRILAKMGILIQVCLCNCSKLAKKKKLAPLTQKETAHAFRLNRHMHSLKSVVLKRQCLKTCEHTTNVVPRLVTSSWFCPGWSFSSPPASVSRSHPVVGGV